MFDGYHVPAGVCINSYKGRVKPNKPGRWVDPYAPEKKTKSRKAQVRASLTIKDMSKSEKTSIERKKKEPMTYYALKDGEIVAYNQRADRVFRRIGITGDEFHNNLDTGKPFKGFVLKAELTILRKPRKKKLVRHYVVYKDGKLIDKDKKGYLIREKYNMTTREFYDGVNNGNPSKLGYLVRRELLKC